MSHFSLQSVNERKLSEKLWKTNNHKANKNGTNSSVYYVKPINDIKHDIQSYNLLTDHANYSTSHHIIHCIYQGEWYDNNKSGHGIQLFVNKKNNLLMKYDGQWCQNVRHGTGKLYISNQTITTINQLNQYNNMNGNEVSYNKLQWRLVYDGEWYNDQKHGTGIYYYCNGDIYTGEWCENNRSGYGTIQHHATNELYTGCMHNNTMNGIGQYNYMNGDIYKGEYTDGIKHGSGVHYYMNKSKLYLGEWNSDQVKCGVYISCSDYIDSIKVNGMVPTEHTTDNNIDITDLLPIISHYNTNHQSVNDSNDITCKIPRLRLANPDNVISDTVEALYDNTR